VIGRFLEHSRLFWFANDGAAEIYIGSADWMPRNLDRRVEAVVPVHDPLLSVQLEWLLELYLHDRGAAWWMQPDGQYRQGEEHSSVPAPQAQQELMELWGLTSAGRSGWSAATTTTT
jgi:polyphosphate kinase